MTNNKFMLISLLSILTIHTALHSAAASIDKNQQLFEAARSGDLALIKSALDNGADVNARDSDQWTLLHFAAYNGRTDAVNALLKAGAEVNAKNSYQNTALHRAASFGHTDAVNALLQARAEVNTKNYNQSTPLHLAAEYGYTDAVNALLKAGADHELINSDNENAIEIANNNRSLGQDKKDGIKNAIKAHCDLKVEQLSKAIHSNYNVLPLPTPLARIIAQYCYHYAENQFCNR